MYNTATTLIQVLIYPNYEFYKRILEFSKNKKKVLVTTNINFLIIVWWFNNFNSGNSRSTFYLYNFLMTYICFFSMHETSHLTLADGLFVLVLGGIGMVIPTPGGVGSYHAIVMIGLSVLGVGTIYLGEGGDPSNPALLFPTIVHVAQTLVAIIMGSAGLLILFLSKKKKDVTS